MEITNCSKADFDQIISDIVAFWGSDRTLHLHQPFLTYEFGSSAFVVKEADQVIGWPTNSTITLSPLPGRRAAARSRRSRHPRIARRSPSIAGSGWNYWAFRTRRGCLW
jgi:hypothetical protein